MHKCVLVGLLVTAVISIPAAVVTGATIQDFLKAPKWYVQYDVTFKVAHTGTGTNNGATTKTNITMNRSFSATCVLDMRMDGPSTVLNLSALSGTGDGSTASVADQMKFQQDLMARMETAANWMGSGGMLSFDENLSDEGQQAAMAAAMLARLGPGSMDYVRIDSSWGLVNEMGTPYTLAVRTTWNGNGMVLPGGGVDPLFEIDAPSATFTLSLPPSFGEMESKMKRLTTRTFTDTNWKNPDVQRDSIEVGMNLFPSNITIDDPKNLQAGAIVIRGAVNPSSGKIAGEHSVAGHYTDADATVPGTFVIHYSLSLTPPAKK